MSPDSKESGVTVGRCLWRDKRTACLPHQVLNLCRATLEVLLKACKKSVKACPSMPRGSVQCRSPTTPTILCLCKRPLIPQHLCVPLVYAPAATWVPFVGQRRRPLTVSSATCDIHCRYRCDTPYPRFLSTRYLPLPPDRILGWKHIGNRVFTLQNESNNSRDLCEAREDRLPKLLAPDTHTIPTFPWARYIRFYHSIVLRAKMRSNDIGFSVLQLS